MTKVKTIADVKKLGTIMGIWAHPDDETFTMGGLMAVAAHNDQEVVCVTATRGEAGVQDETRWPVRHLGKIRSEELADALKILGVEEHYWLEYPDGACAEIYQDEAINRIVSLISIHNPDTILTFGPDGMTGHPDHQTVSNWAGLANERAGSKAEVYHFIHTDTQYQALLKADSAHNIFFNIDKPRTCDEGDCDIYLTLNTYLFKQKMAALRAMPSQTEALLTEFGEKLRDGIGIEAFVKAGS